MKSRKMKIVVFTVICILTLLLLFILIGAQRSDKKPENTTAPKSNYYTVSEYQGKVAVFKNSDNIPFEIYDSYVAVLPEHDRQLLKNGIRANNGEELQKIIEDYTS